MLLIGVLMLANLNVFVSSAEDGVVIDKPGGDATKVTIDNCTDFIIPFPMAKKHLVECETSIFVFISF